MDPEQSRELTGSPIKNMVLWGGKYDENEEISLKSENNEATIGGIYY
jgi:hypothetical protein